MSDRCNHGVWLGDLCYACEREGLSSEVTRLKARLAEAERENERLRKELRHPKGCTYDSEGKPLTICHELATLRSEADRVHKEHAEMIDGYEAKLEEYERRIDELQDEVDSSNQLIDKSARLGTDVCDYDYPPGTAPCMCQFRLVDSSGEPVAECDYHSKIRARLAEAERKHLTAARALVKAFNELNAIRARDGVPRDYAGMKTGVSEEYFSSVVDDVDAAVLALTGLGAHCHPLLYERATDSADCEWCKPGSPCPDHGSACIEDIEGIACSAPAAPRCERCGDSGWIQGNPVIGISDEPCGCDERDASTAPAAQEGAP